MRVGWGNGAASLVAMAGLGLTAACGQASGVSPEGGTATEGGISSVDAGALLDPKFCGTCHTDHFSQWSGSIHAYASQDPVFLAMNRRMQRENPSLGTFCVKCHAPVAVLEGKTTNGLNLSELSPEFLGVTCFFCHSIDAVDTTHAFNAAVTVAPDLVMRGEITDPVPNEAHASKYSAFQDFNSPQSAAMCGACHDIDSPAGGHIERTFAEWEASPFAGTDAGSGAGEVTTCASSGCHMVQDHPDVSIAPGFTPDGGPLRPRPFHEHDFPAVDQAVTPFLNAQQEQANIVAKLANAMQEALCVTQAGGISVVVDTVSLGHDFPSGAAQDRRLWAEIKAFDQAGNVLYQSGVVPDGTSPVDAPDADMWLMRDCMFGTDGGLVDMFWQGATTDSNELPPIAAFLPSPNAYKSHRVRLFPKSGAPITNDAGAYIVPASVTLRMRLQPIGLDVLNDLVSTGDLDAGFVAALPPPIDIPLGNPLPGDTTPTNPILTWTAAAAADGGIAPFTIGDQGMTTCVGSLPIPAQQTAADSHMNPKCTP